MSAACSSSGITAAIPYEQIKYGPTEFPKKIAEHLGMLPARASKEGFPDRADLTQEATFKQIDDLIQPILKDLKDYAEYFGGAVKFSRRRFKKLRCSFTVLSEGRIFLHTYKPVGLGAAKKVRELVELKTRELFTQASSRETSPNLVRDFENELQIEIAVYEKMKDVEGAPSCLAYTVVNAGGVGNSRGLLMKRYDSDLRGFCETHWKTDLGIVNPIKIRLIQTLIDQMTALHGKRIAHLDLKCSNILTNPSEGNGAIIDYSLSLDCSRIHPNIITFGYYEFCAPEIPKNPWGFSTFIETKTLEHCEIIKLVGHSVGFGRKLTVHNLTGGRLSLLQISSLKRVITENLAYAFDVWGLGVQIYGVYFCNRSTRAEYGDAWQALKEYVYPPHTPIQGRVFKTNSMIDLILGMLDIDYENRLKMQQVKERFAGIRQEFEGTGQF